MTHTPGPWEVLNSKCCNDGSVNIKVKTDLDAFETSNLVYAAPELLEACKMAYDYFGEQGILTKEQEVIDLKLYEAISKAEGRE